MASTIQVRVELFYSGSDGTQQIYLLLFEKFRL